MNVGELRKILNKYPVDLPIVLASDSEGNGFSVLLSFSETCIEYDLDNSDVAEVLGNEVTSVLVLWPRR